MQEESSKSIIVDHVYKSFEVYFDKNIILE